MALKFHLISTNFSSISSTTHLFNHKPFTRISCTNKNSISDSALSSDLSARVTRMNTHLVQAEDAMRKSRELLFKELCNYLGVKEDEGRHKWKNFDEEEKWVCVNGFIQEWGQHFQPLSVKSTKEMVEEYLRQGKLNPPPKWVPSSVPVPGLDGIIGF
ncbi:hypothetical protein TanjilG_09012 [Lupinus angustifolius]|uniref:DUF7026 domain-containing protein n=1 Tax=Lupinus angustifolius TaxID=3871 RepID=A0A4P1QPC8_LUPAN|nr:PREDICTED: uncharacterized protein LOC109333722 [Lupinus angustifolius]OIV91600.1 hypothetical protein TanjilG_09012 [Lupinus angustifolius]